MRNPAIDRNVASSMQFVDWLSGASMHIPPWEAFLRLLAAVVVGAAVGFDRELRNKPAGLRTHILISLAAALFTLITFELHHTVVSNNARTTADPIRIIEAVTAGVAFLAAGAIIQSRGAVRGLTTGANMWLAGALGVACGAGDYTLAAFGTVFALLVLVVLGRLEHAARKRSNDDDTGQP
jgi:putative Mg2+ transporter-C (MgtC) family protein